jgi:hypothetical protein
MIGNAIDPIQVQGNKLGDAPTQVAAEGGARAIVYGKGCIRATCIIERGGRRVIRQRDRSGGKGGGPTTINERALWTFAIGLGEPVAGLLRIWENEKLVYDVTPDSTIPEDTAQFAEKFRFYTGAEDQLPDPALEALHGDDTPYYRGTAYLVFPQYDLTDFGETVPTYRVEVATASIELGGTWNPDDIGGQNYLLINENTTLTVAPGAGSADPTVRSVASAPLGSRVYFEFVINALPNPGDITANLPGIGFGNSTFVFGGDILGQATTAWSWQPNGGLSRNVTTWGPGSPGAVRHGPPWGQGDVLGVALDLATDHCWVSINGVWSFRRSNSGTNSPATVGDVSTSLQWPISNSYSSFAPIFAAAKVSSLSTGVGPQQQVTLRGFEEEMQYPIPSGYTALSGSATTNEGLPIALSAVLAALHERAGLNSSDYDVSELVEMSDGVVIESTVTGAEAINSIIGCHFADPSDYDGQIHYIKRGKAVQLTLTEDDLIDEPEVAQRNNSIEYPKKVHFLGQRADLAYASSKATSSRYSSDAQVVGEVTVGSPETFNDGTDPAEIAVKLHKVLWEEAIGEQELVIPDNFLGLVPTDCVGFAYRDQLNRYRILNIEDTPGQRKLRMIKDRQSAYTANLTEIPNPPPVTPPQSSVVAPTVMAFIDTSALTDNADTLHYLVALSGANDNWAGAVLQQQLGGAFTSIDSTTLNAIMGTLQNTVSDASPYYTDTTNEVVVRLFTDDELESRTEAEFLSNGGAFFLGHESSGETVWEIMQFRDAVQDSNGDWVLSHLMRGRKNTPTNEHVPGGMFVWIDPAILREPAQSSWINTELTHRAVSNGQSPELAVPQTNEYIGNSQREWPVAELLLTRPTGTSVEAEAIPRHRFGTSMNPIRSINWDGYLWTVTDGSNTISRTGTSATETFDTTGWASPVTVTVAQLNRITGAGPTVSEDIV